MHAHHKSQISSLTDTSQEDDDEHKSSVSTDASSDAAMNSDFAQEMLRPHPTGAAAARKPPSVPLAPMKRMQAKFNPLADGIIYLVVFLGGCFGTAMRYGLWMWLPYQGTTNRLLMAFHPATFVANMIATFIFALVSSYMSQAIWVHKRTRQLISRGIGMGMCGGFSTLSAMMIEDITAMHSGGYWGFFLYTIISFIAGIIVAWFGAWLGIQLTKRRSAHEAVTRALCTQEHAKPAIGVRVPSDPAIADDHVDSHGYAARHMDVFGGFEPDPDTDEIPVVIDPMTGEMK